MADNPLTDSSVGSWPVPELNSGMEFRDVGSYGLRQYGGWVREEFLPQLVGRQGAGVYREMMDMSPIIGAMIFAITQLMRKVDWNVEPSSNGDDSEVNFVRSLMGDMSHTWPDFVAEALSMLGYGYSVHEIVYKRRLGQQKELPIDQAIKEVPSSFYDDGRIGWRRLPIRGQETVIKWHFDGNGQVKGVTQQPWVGQLIDLPIEKCLLFRPIAHKNNPEGRSVLRSCYRPYYFVKRLEEMESILLERLSGFPVLYVPNELLEAASNTTSPARAAALTQLQAYQKLITNVRIDEQMGAILPSNTYIGGDGKPTNTRMFEFQLLTPAQGRSSVKAHETIERHKIDMLMSLLCDFIHMGHEVRGTNNLAVTKVDMFYAAIEGWLNSLAAVLNRYALPRLWKLNALDFDSMPCFKPDLTQRVDLDGLGNFVANMAAAGMPLFPDDELQEFLRDSAGLPTETADTAVSEHTLAQMGRPGIEKWLKGVMARKILEKRNGLKPTKTDSSSEVR